MKMKHLWICVILLALVGCSIPGFVDVKRFTDPPSASQAPVTIQWDLVVQFILAYFVGKGGWKGLAKLCNGKQP